MRRAILCFGTMVITFTSCSLFKTNTSTFCEERIKDIDKNLTHEKLIYRFNDRYKAMLVDNNIYFERNLKCFDGWSVERIKKLIGESSFHSERYIRYYFNKSCRDTGGKCVFWEFILSKDGQVECFNERMRNIPDHPDY